MQDILLTCTSIADFDVFEHKVYGCIVDFFFLQKKK